MTPDQAALTIAAQRDLDPLVVDLARALSPATRIEAELVRHMRLALLPDADAGLEANLWFSPLVAERDSLGVALVPECRDELRRQLTLPEYRETLTRAWQMILKCHRPPDGAGVPPVINIQEAVTYHALAGQASAASAPHRRSMQLEFGTLFNALDSDSDGSLARWIARALPALPGPARQSGAAIALADKVRSRDSALTIERVPRADQSTANQAPGATLKTIDVGCSRRTDGIEFSVPPADGAHVLRVPRTSPLSLELQTPRPAGWEARSIEFEPSESHVVLDQAPASCCRVMTVDGHRVSVRPVFDGQKPALGVYGAGVELHLGDLAEAVADIGWEVWPATEDWQQRSSPADPVLFLGGSSSSEPPSEDVADDRVRGLPTAGHPAFVWTREGIRPAGAAPPVVMSLHHGENVLSAEFSADATRVVTCGADGLIRIWDAKTGGSLSEHRQGNGTRSATFSPDGARILSVSSEGALRLWTIEEASEPLVIVAHLDWIMAAEFSPGGSRVVSASQDHTALLWSLSDTLLPDAVLEHQAAVNHASFSPDESLVATASDDETVGIWDAASGKRKATLQHNDEVRSAVWSPDGRWVLTTDAGGDAWLWNAATFEAERPPFHHAAELHYAVFSPDGRRIAVAAADGNTWIWHVPSRALMSPPLPHAVGVPAPARKGPRKRAARGAPVKPGVHSVMFSPDGFRLLTGGADGRASIWDLIGPPDSAAAADAIERAVRSFEETPSAVESPQLRAGVRAQLLALDEQRLLSWLSSMAASPVIETTTAEQGDRCLVAIIDSGIDVLHHAFLDAGGRSRIAGIWDQRDPSGRPPPNQEFGTWHSREDIAGYVAKGAVPAALGRDVNGQGTHAASVAAGRAVGTFAGGLAPGAQLLVVIAASREPAGSRFEVNALGFIDEMARTLELPVVVHVSQGLSAGPHDGKSSLEVGFDEFSKGGRDPGRVIVAGVGSARQRNQHAHLTMVHDSVEELTWKRPQNSPWPYERIELWWASGNELEFRLGAPSGEWSRFVNVSQPEVSGTLKGGGLFRMALTRRHVDNGDSELRIELGDEVRGPEDGKPNAAALGTWRLEIVARAVREESSIHAWIEWLGEAPSEFVTHVSEDTTLSIPATAQHVIAVAAAVSDQVPARPADFSSMGPTRDGREKPDLAAPGTDVSGAAGGTADGSIRMDGTSMAAAHVTGTIALVLSRAAKSGRPVPTSNQVVAALRQNTRNSSGRWDRGIGYGVVDVSKFLAAFVESEQQR